jgi:hypothetical protein
MVLPVLAATAPAALLWSNIEPEETVMKVYGRIQDGVVAELLTTNLPIATMFHPALVWVDLTSEVGVAPGWVWNGSQAHAPVLDVPRATIAPDTLSDLQGQIARLQIRLAALTPSHAPS